MQAPMGQNARAMAPPISPDGNFWWDGQAWQPMPAPAPVPAPAPAQPVESDQPAWLDQPLPAAVSAPPPPPDLVVEQPPPVQLWNAPARKSQTWIYVTGILVIVALGVSAFWVRGLMTAQTDNTASLQVPSPSPLMSDYERADRFLNIDMGPSLTDAGNALPPVSAKCTSQLPPACKDALIVLSKAMLEVDDAMAKNQRDIPVCIGPAVQQFKNDWIGMEQGVSQAISGYDANSRSLIILGLQKFAAIANYIKPDVDRINKAEATCPKTV